MDIALIVVVRECLTIGTFEHSLTLKWPMRLSEGTQAKCSDVGEAGVVVAE